MKQSSKFKHSSISDKAELYKILIRAKYVQIFILLPIMNPIWAVVMWNERKITKIKFWRTVLSVKYYLLTNLRNTRENEETPSLVL